MNKPAPKHAEPRGTRLVRFGAFAFPALLWTTAFLFLRGDTGFWADDYYNNLRLPDGSMPPLTFSWKWPLWSLGIKREFFIRPLMYQVAPAVTTLMWRHAWVAHLLQALCHAGVVYLAWRLMRTVGISRGSAWVAALLFLVYPAQYEAVMWVSALPTLLSVATMLGVLFMTAGFARARRRGWWRLAIMAVMTFAACCLNEQPVAGVLVLPPLFWSVLPEEERRWSGRNVARALVPPLVCGIAALGYARLLNMSAPVGFRGSSNTFVALRDAPARLVDFGRQVVLRLGLVGFGAGAWSRGIGAIRSAGMFGVGLLVCAAAAGTAWVVAPWRDAQLGPARRRGWVVLLGLAWFIAGWLPVMVVTVYPPDSRTRYWPCLGLAIAMAAALGGLQVRLVRGALAIAMLACCIVLIGAQAAYQARWEQDRSEGEQLRALVPNPPPFTLFQPMDIRTTGIRTGSGELDSRFHAVWWYLWSTRKFMQSVYGRDDVSAMYWEGDGGMPYFGGDENGLLYRMRLGPRYGVREGDGSRISWDRVVPFIVDDSGRVRLVTTILVPGQSGEVAIHIPLCAAFEGAQARLPRR